MWTQILVVFALISCLAKCAAAQTPRAKVQAIGCAPTATQLAIAVVNNGIWRSGDGGQTWAQLATLPPVQVATSPPMPADDETPTVKNSMPDEAGDGADDLVTEISPAVPIGDPFQIAKQPSTPIRATVADDGRWVILRAEMLFWGGPDRGLTGSNRLPGSRQVQFDRLGQLWILFEDGIGMVRSARIQMIPSRRWSIADTQSLDRGAGTDLVAVTSPSGYWTATLTDSVSHRITVVFHRIGRVSALFATHQRHYLMVIEQRLYRAAVGTVNQRAPLTNIPNIAFPRATADLAIDARDQVFATHRDGSWWLNGEMGWHPIDALVVAMDSTGRPWYGTEAGPVGPRTTSATPNSASIHRPIPEPTGTVIRRSTWEIGRLLGSVPQPRWHSMLLPKMQLFSEVNQRGHRLVELPDRHIAADFTTELYVGLKFTWRFELIEPAAHQALNRRVSALRRRWALKTRALHSHWRALGRQRVTDLKVAINREIQQQSLNERIAILAPDRSNRRPHP